MKIGKYEIVRLLGKGGKAAPRKCKTTKEGREKEGKEEGK